MVSRSSRGRGRELVYAVSDYEQQMTSFTRDEVKPYEVMVWRTPLSVELKFLEPVHWYQSTRRLYNS